jgi:large subunit ribosomal protein L4
MATVRVLDAKGKEVAKRDLQPAMFEAEVSVPLMHQVVVAGMAAIRRGTHSTKTRGDVRGGGKKPWRQKGTGRARQGSSRSPQWAGGGVAHGPHPQDHSMRVNKKMKRGALRSALTDALQSEKLVLLRDLELAEPKTKAAAEILDALELEGKVLVVLPQPSDTGAIEKSFRNIHGVRVSYAKSLGVYEVIAADKLVLTTAALDVLEGAPAEATAATTPEAAAPDEAGETE